VLLDDAQRPGKSFRFAVVGVDGGEQQKKPDHQEIHRADRRVPHATPAALDAEHATGLASLPQRQGRVRETINHRFIAIKSVWYGSPSRLYCRRAAGVYQSGFDGLAMAQDAVDGLASGEDCWTTSRRERRLIE
jgi:hypothetical protein